MTPQEVREFSAALVQAWKDDLVSDRWAPPDGPRDYVYASAHRDCTRWMALDLIHPEEREDFTTESLGIMRRGKNREQDIILTLMKVARRSAIPFDIIETQKSINIMSGGRLIIRGMIDGMIRVNGTKMTAEIKAGRTADGIHSLDDMERNEWGKHWIDQHLGYLLGLNLEVGLFILDHPVPLPIPLFLLEENNLQRAEKFLKDAECAVGCRFGERDLPPFTQDKGLCRRCPHFNKSCAPGYSAGEGAEIITDPELVEAARIVVQNKDLVSTYYKAKERLDSALRGVELAVIGDYQAQGKWQRATKYQLPPEVEEQIDGLRAPYKVTDPQGKFTLRYSELQGAE